MAKFSYMAKHLKICYPEEQVKHIPGAKQKAGGGKLQGYGVQVYSCFGYVLAWPCILLRADSACVTYWHFAMRPGRDWENCLLKTGGKLL